MNGDLIKAGIKTLVAVAGAVFTGTVAKKGHEDYQRYKQNNPPKNS